MSTGAKILTGTIALIIVAIYTAITFGVTDVGVGFANKSKENISQTLASKSDPQISQYDNGVYQGSQVVSVIKEYWEDNNTIAILVSSKDGSNILYDHDGYVGSDIKNNKISGFPATTAAEKNFIIGAEKFDTSLLTTVTLNNQSCATASKSMGYNAAIKATTEGYIGRNNSYASHIQLDANNNVRCITFIQN